MGVMKYNDPILKPRRQELRHNETDAEKVFWSHVRNKKLQGLKFFRQYSIGPYILDFYCPEKRIAVELDGSQHSEEENREYDAERTEYLRAQDIEVIRFWNHEVLSDIEGILFKITERATRERK